MVFLHYAYYEEMGGLIKLLKKITEQKTFLPVNINVKYSKERKSLQKRFALCHSSVPFNGGFFKLRQYNSKLLAFNI